MNRPAGGDLKKRSVAIAGHRTSVSLEEEFWDALRDIAAGRSVPLSVLIREIDLRRGSRNLSSAIRIYVLAAVRAGEASLP